MRILLLEDETAIRSAVARGLRRAGHEVVDADSLEQARQGLEHSRPELLITDLKLPDGSGLELAEELGLRFVVMSGYADFADAVRALRAGCVDFFTKPVALRELLRCVERVAGGSGRRQAVVVDAEGGLRLVAGGPDGMRVSELETWQCSWYTGDEARAAFSTAAERAARNVRERQIMAELMQLSGTGRLVVNRGEGVWRAWLATTVNGEGQSQQDRRILIDSLADSSVWRTDGVLVECCHAD